MLQKSEALKARRIEIAGEGAEGRTQKTIEAKAHEPGRAEDKSKTATASSR
ncbi:MAG: hypothetical protein LC747_00385 [Acidobacteria bacterium]|nr:hypothetical protein [Acidobacteriota bacterium]